MKTITHEEHAELMRENERLKQDLTAARISLGAQVKTNEELGREIISVQEDCLGAFQRAVRAEGQLLEINKSRLG